MKYRLLNTEELAELEKEFIHFLIVNSITAEDWTKMKLQDPAGADEMIALFSDMVLDNVLQKIKYLEYRSEDNIMLFRCDEDKMLLMGLSVNTAGINLNDSASLESIVKNPSMLSDGSVKLFKQEKKYLKQREEELFDMTEQGCYITDEKLFNVFLALG